MKIVNSTTENFLLQLLSTNPRLVHINVFDAWKTEYDYETRGHFPNIELVMHPCYHFLWNANWNASTCPWSKHFPVIIKLNKEDACDKEHMSSRSPQDAQHEQAILVRMQMKRKALRTQAICSSRVVQ